MGRPFSRRLMRGSCLVLLLALCGTHAQDDFDAILSWVAQFADMPPEQQSAVLMAAGFALQAKTGSDCNIFGGKMACKALAPDTSYKMQCGAKAQPTVDCALYDDVSKNLYDSPVDDLQNYLEKTLGPRVKTFCPECFDRVQSLWCALAAPPCGTFNTVVAKGMLPVLSEAVKEYRYGGSQADAIGSVMVESMDITRVGVPCREMCEAMASTCSCGPPGNDTLGSLLTWLAGQPQLKDVSKLPIIQYARVLFKNVWDVPFCMLFPAKAEQVSPGGTCDLPPVAHCTARTSWCDATHPERNDMYKYVQSLLLVQLIRANNGWFMRDNTIIWGIHDSVNNAVAEHTDAAAAGSQGHQLKGGQIAGIVFLCLVATALMSVGAVMGFRWWKARQSEENYLQLTEKESFIAIPAGGH